MENNEATDTIAKTRINIIQAVQNPISFFVLVVLIVEGILAVFVLQLKEGEDRTFVIRAMIILIFMLVTIVTVIALLRPSILIGKDVQQAEVKYSLLIGPPTEDEWKNLEITNIDWNNDECFLVSGNLKARITLVRAKIGPTFRVDIPTKILEKVKDKAIFLDLKDLKGNRWEVKSFYLYENLLPLAVVESKARIIRAYGDEGQ
jgi:hypothetical protein